MNTVNISFSAHAIKSDSQLPTRFKGVAYRGDLIRGHVNGDTMIELSSLNVGKEVIVLFNHDPAERLGKASLSIDGEFVRVSGTFSNTSKAMEVRQEFADGMPFELSLGLIGEAFKPKEHTIINGRYAKPDTVLRKSTVRELSVVSLGAASGTEVMAFAGDSRRTELELCRLLLKQVSSPHIEEVIDGSETELQLATLLFTQIANVHHGVHG